MGAGGVEQEAEQLAVADQDAAAGRPALVTLIDDPGVPGGRGSIAVDDEGVVPGPHLLIERGILRGSLHDRLSAAAAGLPPGGSGRRQSFRDAPLPRMTNTWMAAGDGPALPRARAMRDAVRAATSIAAGSKLSA